MKQETGFRSESYSGSQVRNLDEILCFEIRELGNTDILEHILQTHLIPESSEIENRILDIIKECEEECVLDDCSWDDFLEDCSCIIQEICKTTGQDLKYGLWLTDKESCIKFYNHGSAEGIEEYPAGNIVLSDLGKDGKLYAYTEFPERIHEKEQSRNVPEYG